MRLISQSLAGCVSVFCSFSCFVALTSSSQTDQNYDNLIHISIPLQCAIGPLIQPPLHLSNVIRMNSDLGFLSFAGRSAHLVTFEVGAALEDAKWQAPVYCFNNEEKASAESHSISNVFQQRLKEISKSFDGVLNARVPRCRNPCLVSVLIMILANWVHLSLFESNK